MVRRGERLRQLPPFASAIPGTPLTERRKAYLNHLDIALGSQGEVDVQLELAKRLRYCSSAQHLEAAKRVDRVGRMLNGLIASLQPVEEDWRD
ncbi:MAG: four helix bundle protein [Vicinamibacterales bacterium]